MKILITGSKGFIGKNLVSHLQEQENIEIISFDVEDNFEKIEENIDSIDFIFHLAGVNRPQNPEEFYTGNSDLTKRIVDLIKDKNIPFLVTSSIQAVRDNDYGKSKKIAEDYIIDNLKKYYIYRLHNVFGKWCKPNYNSVIATFCYNIAHDLDITVNDPSAELELIYIDDIIYEFIRVLKGIDPDEKQDNYCYINPRYKVTLDYITKKLYEFKDSMNSIYVPNTGNDFIKKLYATYVSYVDTDKTFVKAVKNVDERGAFIELMRTYECGQFSVSFSKPGVVRGNHYHHTKMERFIVIKGKAKISFSSVINDDKYSFIVDDSEIKIVTIPVGYTHNIENIGDDEMILAIWCNELFDKKHPDTYFKKVEE
ncbi:MAG: NAD-dependent epimerase/dehydratase family protein [Bacilli bacterium]|nr:NAD-dependent epimerase/dehydratase family protein [Bacilli bacterium]